MATEERVRVAIADIGVGNHVAVANMIRRAGGAPVICMRPDDVKASTHLVLPGVGAWDKGMQGLNRVGWPGFLHEFAAHGSILGICLGMQLLGEASAEGVQPGLGLVPVVFRKFNVPNLKTPHMGWNSVTLAGPDPLLGPASEEYRYYFAHSYYATCGDETVVATCTYGHAFPAVVRRGRVAGVQFHPEKSHRFGQQLFQRFIAESFSA